MKASVTWLVLVLCLVVIGVFFALAGIYVGETDDAPGAALLGILIMIGCLAFALRIIIRRKGKYPGCSEKSQ